MVSVVLLCTILLRCVEAVEPPRGTLVDNGGWCSKHGSWTSGGSCPICQQDAARASAAPAPPPLTPAEIAHRQQLQKEADERAEKAAAEARVAASKAANDASLEQGKRIANALLGDQRSPQPDRTQAGKALGDRLLEGLPNATGANTGLDFATPGQPLFSRGSQDSAPVAPNKDFRLAGDANKPLEFIGVPQAPVVTPPASRPAVVVPDPRMQMPSQEDIELLFPPDLVQRRWPGPINPGPRLVNPLIEEERQEQLKKVKEAADRELIENALTLFQSPEYEDAFFNHLIAQTEADPQLSAISLNDKAKQKSRNEALRQVTVQIAPQLTEARKRAVAELATEVEVLNPAHGTDLYARAKTDPVLQARIDEARIKVLKQCGLTINRLSKSCIDGIRPNPPSP